MTSPAEEYEKERNELIRTQYVRENLSLKTISGYHNMSIQKIRKILVDQNVKISSAGGHMRSRKPVNNNFNKWY